MEQSNVGSWLMNFEMNYSSIFQDFEQFGEPAPSPMLPDFSSIFPECCLSNSNSDPNQSPEVYNTSKPQENNSSEVGTDQTEKKKKTISKSWNSGLKKGKNCTGKEGSDKSDGTNNTNVSSKASKGRKRNYDLMTAEDETEKNSTSSAEPATQPEYDRKGHVIAERKRREKLTQRFIALSSLVPGLTRMDKASVLGDAIKYVKQLQEKVQTLETEATQKAVQAAVIVKKSQSSPDECNSTTCDVNSPDDELSTKTGPLPEILVRISGQRVLIKIHCENQKGVLVKALSEIESLGLTIGSTSVVPFAKSSFDMTVTAKVGKELSLTVEGLIKRLKSALRQF